ncbi:MAG: pyruvate dehydrogenase complex dihydrolipoamide acetyltransferase [Xanthobacteraceae bacterium]
MDVLMPQLGETVAEGKISTWFKQVGDDIKAGDNLFEIETDKVSMEVPAIAPGVLAEIRIPAGETALVGAIVAVISDTAGATTSPQAAATGAPPKTPISPPKVPAAAPASVDQPKATRPIALDPFREVRTPDRNYGRAKLASGAVTTPLARRLAGEAGIDVSRVQGSGPHGRIVARDVEAAISAKPAAPAAVPAARTPSADQVKALYQDTPFEEVPLDNMRRTIAARLTRAAQTIPHFYLSVDLTLDRLLALREEANAAAPDDSSALKLSVNDFVIKALALALQRVPAANAVWAEDRILRFRHSDIGIAVALEGGLLTPVIRRAETKSLTAISAEMKDLAARARDRKLKPQEYQGGSTAISNLGMHGISAFTAIINPPHATILAVGAVQRRPIETQDGGVKFVSQMTVTLSCDHRVVDGALGAQLLAALKGFIEQPVTMLV